MLQNPKNLTVSVVIPARNEEERISSLMVSILNQNIYPDEVIVVDNDSTDSTKQIVSSFANRFKTKNIKYLVLSENQLGCAYARNTGFFASSSTIIASTDADIVLHEDWVEKIHQHFHEHDSIAVTGITVIKDSNIIVRTLSELNWYKYLTTLLRIIFGFQTISTANSAIKRVAFESIRGFNTNCKSPDDLDDTELSSRLHLLGAIRVDTKMRVDGSFRRYQPLSRGITSSARRLKSWLVIAQNKQR